MQTHSTLINLTAFFYLMKRKDSFFHLFYSASGKASKSNKPNLYFMDIEIRIQHQRRSPVYFYESCSVAHEAQKIDFPGVKSAGAGWGAKFGFSPPISLRDKTLFYTFLLLVDQLTEIMMAKQDVVLSCDTGKNIYVFKNDFRASVHHVT